MKRLHNVVCFCIHPGHKDLQCTSVCTMAEDLAEALAGRMDWLKSVYPPDLGWESHSVGAVMIPDDLVMLAAEGVYEHRVRNGTMSIAPSDPAQPFTADQIPFFSNVNGEASPPPPDNFHIPTDAPPMTVDLSDPNTAMPIA